MSPSTAAVEPHASNFIIDAYDESFGVKVNGLHVFFYEMDIFYDATKG